VEVHNGVPLSITPVNPGEPVDTTTLSKYDTVEELFGVNPVALPRGRDRRRDRPLPEEERQRLSA
jgi:hypothetical protein